MAGIYADPLSRVSTGYRQPAHNPVVGRQWSPAFPAFPRGPAWVQQASSPDARFLAGGCIPALDGLRGCPGGCPKGLRGPEDAPQTSTAAYAAISTMGAAAGGALLGYVSSGSREGAQTGAAFSAGVSALADAVLFAREGHPGATAAMAFLGLGALSWSLYRFHESVAARR